MIKTIIQAVKNWYKSITSHKSRNQNIHKSRVIKRGMEWD